MQDRSVRKSLREAGVAKVSPRTYKYSRSPQRHIFTSELPVRGRDT